MKDLRYPIGNFEFKPFDEETKKGWLNDIKNLPNDLELVVKDLNKAQLETPYRDGGWTVQQVVHHLADSHMNWIFHSKVYHLFHSIVYQRFTPKFTTRSYV